MNKAEGLERQAAAANFWQRALIILTIRTDLDRAGGTTRV